jgi:hypothetical protein
MLSLEMGALPMWVTFTLTSAGGRGRRMRSCELEELGKMAQVHKSSTHDFQRDKKAIEAYYKGNRLQRYLKQQLLKSAQPGKAL